MGPAGRRIVLSDDDSTRRGAPQCRPKGGIPTQNGPHADSLAAVLPPSTAGRKKQQRPGGSVRSELLQCNSPGNSGLAPRQLRPLLERTALGGASARGRGHRALQLALASRRCERQRAAAGHGPPRHAAQLRRHLTARRSCMALVPASQSAEQRAWACWRLEGARKPSTARETSFGQRQLQLWPTRRLVNTRVILDERADGRQTRNATSHAISQPVASPLHHGGRIDG